jgi:hypothetical protein
LPPFAQSDSCTSTKWCAAITIDSLESQFNFVNLNPGCKEPVNFAFLQRNGVAAGPPGPQTVNADTMMPNDETLEMNPGDTVEVAITDPAAGLTATVTDFTTGQTGTMTASAGNGFMNTNYLTCAGSPFTFHAEYGTAQQQNSVPWAALDGGVLMEQEIGHGEVCASLKNRDPYTATNGVVTNPTHVIYAHACAVLLRWLRLELIPGGAKKNLPAAQARAEVRPAPVGGECCRSGQSAGSGRWASGHADCAAAAAGVQRSTRPCWTSAP